MKEIPHYYTVLFNAVTDALGAMDGMNPWQAKALLIWGQQAAEEEFLSVREDFRLYAFGRTSPGEVTDASTDAAP